MTKAPSKPFPTKARERIQADRILKKLQEHCLTDAVIREGAAVVHERPMTASQLKAAEILLRKCIPDLKAVEVRGEDGGPIRTRLEIEFVSVK